MQNADTAHTINIRRFVLTAMVVRIRTSWSASPCKSRRRSAGPVC